MMISNQVLPEYKCPEQGCTNPEIYLVYKWVYLYLVDGNLNLGFKKKWRDICIWMLN